MPEDDTIGRIIRRDLDRLPMLPADRWVPRARPDRGPRLAVSPRLMRGVLAFGAAAFLIVGSLAVGSAVRALRSSPAASEPQPVVAHPLGICAASQDRVLGLSGIVTRLDRIAVKRMTVQDLDAGRTAGGIPPSQPAAPLASNTVLCVVAVSGEIRQSFGLLDTGPSKWAVFVSIAGGDEPTISSSMGNDANWPPYFDALPDRQGTPYPGTVAEMLGSDELKVRLESAVLSAEFGNPVLVKANKYTLIQPGAATVAGTGVQPGDRVAVFFEREGRNPSDGAYPLSIIRLTDAANPLPTISKMETPTVSLTLTIGDGPTQPGLNAPPTRISGGIPPQGPTSLAVDDQWIYIWDQAHSRILVFGKTPPSRAIPVAIPSTAIALEVAAGRLYLRDRVEYEIDAATGTILRTYGPLQSGGVPTIYPRDRDQYQGFASPTKVPGGAGQTVGTDERGNHYERFVNATCSTGAATCVELRRVSADGRVLVYAPEPIGAEVVDYYITRDGAAYELRKDRAPDGHLAGVFVVRLLAPIP